MGLQTGDAVAGDWITYILGVWTYSELTPDLTPGGANVGVLHDAQGMWFDSFSAWYSAICASFQYDGETTPRIEWGPNANGVCYVGAIFRDAQQPQSFEGMGMCGPTLDDPVPYGAGAAYWRNTSYGLRRREGTEDTAVISATDPNWYTLLCYANGDDGTPADNNSYASGGTGVLSYSTLLGNDGKAAILGHPTRPLYYNTGLFDGDADARPNAAIAILVPGL